ncbi:MAG TPA: hypothetical protein VK856_03255 [Anaerolineaceae bacterium]|nr:hypothetical protein [Anaerolineaceae bacterium]
MILTLVGMSGTGKSYWSKKLESRGFIRFGCDDLITQYLAAKLELDALDQFDMHQWVGYPDEKTYEERALQYLQAEEFVLNNIFDHITNAKPNENIVIDSTGSVIYMKDSILKKLNQLTKIIYLDITPQDYEKMLRYYLNNPVAIIWNGFFQPVSSETRQQTFARCYPQLVKSREAGYRKLAHTVIPAQIHRAETTSVSDFLTYLIE